MRSLLCVALALAAPVWVKAEAKERSVAWDRLAPEVTKRKATIELVSGDRVSGRILLVGPAEMSVKTGKRQVSLARADVSRVYLFHHRARGKIIGTLCGAASGFAIGGAIVAATFLTGGAGAGTAIFASLTGMPVAGFFLGRAADRQQVVIRVVP